MVQMTPTIHNTLGLLFQAVVFSSILYGAGCLQAWFYYEKYMRRDKLWTKALIALIIAADTAQMGCLTAAVYVYSVTNQGNPDSLVKIEKSLIIELFFSAIIAFSVQQFYCFRIYLLSKNKFLALGVSAISWAAFVTLLVYSARAMQLEDLADLGELRILSTVTNSLSAAADVVISVTMIMILQNAKTGFKRSTDMLNRLIIWTFNTGLPTSICAIVAVITINAASATFLYIFFFILMGRFYTNSILVTLNSREFIMGGTTDPGDSEYSLPARGTTRIPGLSRGQEITIRIDTTTQDYRPNDTRELEDKDSSDHGKLPV